MSSFILETRLRRRAFSSIKNSLGFECGVHVNYEGRRGSLVLLWCKELDVEVKSFSLTHIDIFVLCEGKMWHFMSFYGNSTRSQRHHSWELIRHLKGLFILPWIVPGNFNEIVNLSKKLRGSDQVHSDMRRFGKTINDYELHDLGFFGAAMKWNNG